VQARSRRRALAPLTLALALSLLVASCSSSSKGASTDTSLAAGGTTAPAAVGSIPVQLVGFSTVSAVITELQKQIPIDFPATKVIKFTNSFGPSVVQSKAVAAGTNADIVYLSTEADVQRLVAAGKVAPEWNQTPYRGMLSDSVVVFVVRKGNPKNITTWADLVKPGVQVVSPNPFSSGGGQWNTTAAYGAQLKLGNTPAQAMAYVTSLYKNIVQQDESSQAAMQTFLGGKGDVLLAYESDAIPTKKSGAAIDYLIPTQTILVENPATYTKTDKAFYAKFFLDYAHNPPQQRVFADNGYRPVISGVSKPGEFPVPKDLFTIALLGGWARVEKDFFNPTTGSIATIEQGLGVSTGS
jgi:sulfate/thiosulfate transport system substrate-binding protein